MQDGSAPGWRQTLDRHHSALIEDLAAQLDADLKSSVARAVLAEREQADAEAVRERERLQIEAARERERLENEAARALAAQQTRAAEETKLALNAERERAKTEIARAAEESRRSLSESLNQTLRRIRQTAAEHETLQLLLDDSPANRAVVLLIENNQARIAAWRGLTFRNEEDECPIDLKDAAALASCVESRDPMIALTAPGEISSLLALALNGTGAAKAYLFPVVVRQKTVALMMACGDVAPVPIELLCEAAGMKLESFNVRVASPAPQVPAVPLVHIAAAGVGVAASVAQTERTNPSGNGLAKWSNLTLDEQALHLRAQRFARVRVAQIRINEPEALREGTQTGNVYGALRSSIDAARDEYRRCYMSQSITMVDYLHLEIIRSLAHEDDGLLGLDYPGPIE